ncbi:MAG TPA: choice-of-anchor Q domain-containing protein [Polyangiaceae bacterium]|nr:choice-of-anchor Q domain-containing protein [Polyangiaceae bacterium]
MSNTGDTRPPLVSRFVLLGAALASTQCDPNGNFSVTNTADGGEGSLRAAITLANDSVAEEVRIEIAPGTYALTRCGGRDDANASGDLDLTRARPVTLVAPNGNVVIRQTCPGERVLEAHGAGRLTLNGLSISGGALVTIVATEVAAGGGVRAAADVVLQGTVITGNSVTAAAGVVAAAGAESVPGSPARGGGLFVGGSLTADGASTLSRNGAWGGAGVDGRADAPVPAAGGSAEGGGAFVAGAITLSGTRFAENTARGAAGGSGLDPTLGGNARGGGLAQAAASAAPVELSYARFESNLVQGGASGAIVGTAEVGAYAGAGSAEGGGVAAAGPVTGNFVSATRNRALGGSSGYGATLVLGPGNGPGQAGAARGGGVAAGGAVNLSSAGFALNAAVSGDTSYSCSPSQGCFGTAAATAAGGAVFARGALSVGGQFSENSAKRGLGTVSSEGARGGALASDTSIADQRGTYTANAITGSSTADGLSGRGGAISAPNVELSFTRLDRNTADGPGGAVDANTLVASNVTATYNRASGAGGGALYARGEASITDSGIRHNAVDSRMEYRTQVLAGGGGVLVNGPLTIRDSWIASNEGQQTVSFSAPQIGSFAAPGRFLGGGVRAASVLAENVTLTDNQLSGNTLLPGIPIPVPTGNSGGGAIAATSEVSLINVTLSGNKLFGNPAFLQSFPQYAQLAQGSAVLAESVTLEHATFIENQGAEAIRAANLTTNRSVAIPVAGTTVCASGIASSGARSYNWFGDASCGLTGATNRQESASFLLGSLVDTGAGVPVRAPEPGSVLIDRIPAAQCPTPSDARDVARPQGAGCDIGAAEAQL